MKRIVIVLLVGLFAWPPFATAGPILESVMRRAAVESAVRIVQAQGLSCQDLTIQGREEAEDRGTALWLVMGMLPIYFIPAAPIAAHSMTPEPPTQLLTDLDRAQVECFADGYSPAMKGKRIRSSWIGFGISVGISALLVASVAASVN
jgi:hypothetical protein